MPQDRIKRESDGTWRARIRFMPEVCDRIDRAVRELDYMTPIDLIQDAVEAYLRQHDL